MKLITIILLSIFFTSCTTEKGQLNLYVNFPLSSPVLSIKEKTELKRNIAIKNASLFTEEEKKELLGEIEVIIK